MSTIPPALSLQERKVLLHTEIKKHKVANILLHWFNAAAWAFLLLTGLGILSSALYRVIPVNWLELVRSSFGGLANLRKFHMAAGLTWIFVLGFNVVFGIRKYFGPFGRESLWLTRDDLEWLKMQPMRMLGKKIVLPPQDAYNAGQKAYALAITAGSLGIMATGLIMTFSRYMPARWIVQWANPLHFLSWGSVIAALIVHLYMGAVMPEERSAFFSIFTGKVNALYAFHHHYKWYRRSQLHEANWEERLRQHTEEEQEMLAQAMQRSASDADTPQSK
jgi:formate dehydrogenase gamma subunit